MSKKNGWTGIDLDGTLAHYESGQGVAYVGAPIPKMVERVRGFLAEGKTVKILTARVAHRWLSTGYSNQGIEAQHQITMIQAWCLEHLGQILPVTAVKDTDMEELYDDRAIGVVKNTGELRHEVEYQRGLQGPVCTHDRVCDCR